MTIQEALLTYRRITKKLKAYEFASGIIYYDAATVAPENAAPSRGEVLEFLAEEEYNLRTGKEMTEAIETLTAALDSLSPVERREIEVYNRMASFVAAIPKEEYLAYTVLTNEAEAVWHKAKNENDFAAFEPYLARIFEANKKFALYFKPCQDPYDTCLDLFEKGLTKEKADAFFSLLRERIVPLIARIGEKEQIDDSFLYRHYPIEKQREFSDRLLALMAIDRKDCAIGETEHPFTMTLNKHDVRVTTHYYEDNLASSMYSVIHEGGHALYELGGGDEYEGTALCSGTSTGIHESQSRLYENIIGRSRAFISLVYPIARELFPEQLSDVTEEMFYRAVNKSTPSLIRTEADELTYSLHVMVRYEIEKGLLAGEYSTKDLPAIWNAKMKEYLGIDVPDDKQGVLQDSHWSGGSVGYFPSYALGSAYSSMFWNAMQKELDTEALIREGKLCLINDWLKEKIHRHASRFDPSELIASVCGGEFDPAHYVSYLEEKFKDIYSL